MSRIQDILKKAERDGSVHRTRALTPEGPAIAQASAMAPAMPMPPSSWAPAGPDVRTAAPPITAASLRRAAAQLDGRLVAALAPQSLAAEQYRSLRTRLTRAESARAMRTIIVTSPAKGDGKSLTAGNLALTMAQEFQQRVLLLDADLRRPSIHRLFGVAESPGLSDVLMGGATIEDALLEIPEYHLTVMPSGIVPTHPAELLGSAAMRRVLDTLRTRFDRIILDMPPVAPLADVTIASGLADGVLLIVRAGVTPKPAIERALAGLDLSKVLGLVLNDGGDSASHYGYGADGYVAG
jgi:capsular exopolysaccharide synthesis family protein